MCQGPKNAVQLEPHECLVMWVGYITDSSVKSISQYGELLPLKKMVYSIAFLCSQGRPQNTLPGQRIGALVEIRSLQGKSETTNLTSAKYLNLKEFSIWQSSAFTCPKFRSILS